jgi:short-subunit dehydrogenase
VANQIDERDRSDEGRGKTALVTGASSGIGLAFSELLAAKGYTVLPVARRRERLDQLAAGLSARWDVEVQPFVGDLSDPRTPGRVLSEVAGSGRSVDFLVNNAGDSRIGRYDQLPWELHDSRLHLMGVSTLHFCHGVLPGMVERGWGRIVNVSSIGAIFTGFPTDILYNATKGMVERFSEALDGEFRRLGVRCTVVLPGPTPTEIFTHQGTAADVAEHPLFRHIQTPPSAVVRESYAAVMRGKPFVVPGVQYKPLATVLQYSPRVVRRRLSEVLCKVMAD